ncbi:epoxide hydrolase 4-like [Thrips palmi]|uniref:Epoxide hydrolase 4-like n=1 Tax=Thrips palmi TaxID=161013 RepID=A0A6P8ZJG7_THRPL|nr:epoxide hydrolase 4-like [Thrips palmi]
MEPKWTASAIWVVAAVLYIGIKCLITGCYAVGFMVFKQMTTPRWLFTYKRRLVPPKSLQDPDLGQHGYVTVKGLKFHFVEKGDRSKPLMLFLHGFPDFWYSWRHQMREFSKDYWTVALDMRGYGDSDKPTGVFDYSVTDLVDDIKGVVTALGRKKFILVGHDWGAVLSWSFLDRYPEMIDKYILMNGPSLKVFTQLLISFSSDQSSKSWYTFLFQIPYLAELFVSFNDFGMLRETLLGHKTSSPYITEDDIEAYKYNFSQRGYLSPPLRYYKATYQTIVRQGLFPDFVGAPTTSGPRPQGLYLHGAQDIAVDSKCVVMLQFSTENLKTLVLNEGNHFVNQGEPLAVNNAIRSFLQ